MTKTTQKTHLLKGRTRHATFLDKEFRRAKEEWTRASRALRGAFGAGENQKAEPSGMMLLGDRGTGSGETGTSVCPRSVRVGLRLGESLGWVAVTISLMSRGGWSRLDKYPWPDCDGEGSGGICIPNGNGDEMLLLGGSDGGTLMCARWGKAAIPLPGHSVRVQSDSAGDVDKTWRVRGDVRAAWESRMSTTLRPRAPTNPQPLPRLPPMLAQHAREEHDKSREGGVSGSVGRSGNRYSRTFLAHCPLRPSAPPPSPTLTPPPQTHGPALPTLHLRPTPAPVVLPHQHRAPAAGNTGKYGEPAEEEGNEGGSDVRERGVRLGGAGAAAGRSLQRWGGAGREDCTWVKATCLCVATRVMEGPFQDKVESARRASETSYMAPWCLYDRRESGASRNGSEAPAADGHRLECDAWHWVSCCHRYVGGVGASRSSRGLVVALSARWNEWGAKSRPTASSVVMARLGGTRPPRGFVVAGFGARDVPLRVTNPGDNMSMSSSSGSLAEIRNPKPTKTSPLRDGITYHVPPLQDNANAQPRRTGRTVLGSSNLSPSSSGSNRSQKSKSSRKEKTLRVKDDDKILMDDQDKVAMSDDYATWHGLERRLSARSASKPSLPHDSPWLGPLVNLDEDITYTPDHSDSHPDLYSLYYTRTRTGSVVPIESLLSVMGYLTPEAAVLSNTPLPYGSYTPLPATSNSSPHASYTAPHVLPRVPSSPYQLQLQSPSHACMPVGYGNRTTLPMQPLRSSPGTVYPPTAYTSPAPARYSSPYPPASPAAGYTTSPCVAASPAAMYTNLAQSYSSPYVPPLQGRGYYN
ncbi:hypothetical protein B0H14DRAFT_2562957 [Mycena olivaceomarginata]|nr:hypothetical protein B0H14DRAFT_2562957 [Mycena olivaceomarginata]